MSMQAVVCASYGGPDVLKLRELAVPEPKADQIRIRVHASTAGPAGTAFRTGDPFIVRLMFGWARPRQPITGSEFAGVVDSCGSAVTQFKPGQRVCGLATGAHADFVCMSAAGTVGLIPDGVGFDEAASYCDGATYALTFLRDKARVQPGQSVLVNGASGAIGVYAVQLAKCFGAEVTGVCSAVNVELVKSLGADHVIDYTREDFARGGVRYDVIFDTVGKRSFWQCAPALTPKGVYLLTVPTAAIVFQMLGTAFGSGKKAIFAPAGTMQNRANIEFLGGLCASGRLKAVIDRRYPLAKIVDASTYVDTGRKRGTVVLQHIGNATQSR